MKLNCLIVDDEPVARKGMVEYVQEVQSLHLVGQCENALKATALLNDHAIDLMFLDIQMPKLTGIEFLKTLKNPPLIIFTTAFSEYALDGYALDVVDYLLKPVSFDRFLKAVQKASEIYSLKTQKTQQPDYFFVKSDSRFEKVLYEDVAFVEGLQNYVIIHLRGRKLITYLTMTSLEQQLPADRFIKVHKSYIVSKSHVKAIEGNELCIGESRIPISRTLREQVIQQIMGDRLFRR